MNPFVVGAGIAGLVGLAAGAKRHPEVRRTLSDAMGQLEDWTDLLGRVSLNHPMSWLGVAQRVLQYSVDGSWVRFGSQWLAANGYEPADHGDLGFLWEQVRQRSPQEVVFKSDNEVVVRVNLAGGSFCIENDVHPRIGRDLSLYLPVDPAVLGGLMRSVAEVFWRGRSVVMLDQVGDGMRLIDVALDETPFVGPLLDEILNWQRYREAGLRRSILLQGRPGSGKSTLARAAARRLSKRTLVMTARAADELRPSSWQMLLQVLQPEFVILDDVDRLNHLDDLLSVFEEAYCRVPYLVFTSNDHLQIPQAMRRPGRIDQIIEVGEPDEAQCREILLHLARRESVEVPEARVPELLALIRSTSNAHVLERFRRARVEGWEARPVPGDITFSKGFEVEVSEP